MKKIVKKLNFFTKVFVVLSMLFSNLTSLSYVFAYETEENFDANIEEDKIVIDYLSEIEDEDTVKIDVSENYTYLDDSQDTETVNTYDVVGSDLTAGKYEITSSILSNIMFDGVYSLSVSLYNVTDSEDLGTITLEQTYEFDSGMKFSLVDQNDSLLSPNEDGKYEIKEDSPSFSLVGTMLPGGISPSDTFTYDEVTYTASEVLSQAFVNTVDLSGYLYGEYTVPVEIEIVKNEEIVKYNEDINLLYGSYFLNSLELNQSASKLELDDGYRFSGSEKDGTVKVYLNDGTSMYDLYNIVTNAIGENELITYVITDQDGNDVMSEFDSETGDIQEYLSGIALRDGVKLALMCDDLTITYEAIVLGDLNDDLIVDETDLEALIRQAIGKDEANLDKGNFILDDKIDFQDAVYLDRIIKNKKWKIVFEGYKKEIPAKLNVNSDEITSGDEFTVDYVVTVSENGIDTISGLVDYDSEALELVDMKSETLATGDNYQRKYLYINSESLEADTTTDDSGETVVNPTDYTLLTLTFRALKAGSSTVTLKEIEYFNQNERYMENDDVSASVTVNESADDSLASLRVGEEEIKLEDGVLEYEITVPNEITKVEIEAILNNPAAKLSLLSGPEVLAEGENIYTIVVTAENGDEKTYTVKVNREAAPREESIVDTVSYVEDNNSNQQENDTTVVTPPKSSNDDKKADDSNDNQTKKGSNLSRIVIIILILLVIAGLIYLIFKDNNDDEEKQANKDINRMKKDDFDSKPEKIEYHNQSNNKNRNGNNYKNNKKGR